MIPQPPTGDPLVDVMRRHARQMIAAAFGAAPGTATHVEDAFTPSAELWETAEGYVVVVDLPGVTSDDVTVEVHDGVVDVRGERRTAATGSDAVVHWCTRRYGRFHLEVRLPADGDVELVGVAADAGELVVRLARRRGH